MSLTRFATRFAALFEAADNDPVAWQARHGIDATTYQQTFDALVNQGFRLVSVNGYSEGMGSRFNAVWHQRPGPSWQARHGLTSEQYQATFDSLVAQGHSVARSTTTAWSLTSISFFGGWIAPGTPDAVSMMTSQPAA